MAAQLDRGGVNEVARLPKARHNFIISIVR